jgi:hypothetical protein
MRTELSAYGKQITDFAIRALPLALPTMPDGWNMMDDVLNIRVGLLLFKTSLLSKFASRNFRFTHITNEKLVSQLYLKYNHKNNEMGTGFCNSHRRQSAIAAHSDQVEFARNGHRIGPGQSITQDLLAFASIYLVEYGRRA